MSADLFDGLIVEMTRIAQEGSGNIVSMLESFEDRVREWELISLSKLRPSVLALEVDVLHPAVMCCGDIVGDVLLENHYVGVWQFFGIAG